VKQAGGASNPERSFVICDEGIPTIQRDAEFLAEGGHAIGFEAANLAAASEPDHTVGAHMNTVNSRVNAGDLGRRDETIAGGG